MRIKKEFDADIRNVKEIIAFISKSLEDSKIKSKDRTKAALVAEEAAVALIRHIPQASDAAADPASRKISVILKSLGGSVFIELSAEGESFSFAPDDNSVSLADKTDPDEIEASIRNSLLSAMTDSLKYTHRHGTNYIRMVVIRSKQAFLYRTIGALVLAVILGLILSSLLPAEASSFINSDILIPIKTMYLNALKMIVAPVVFLSIITCISQFTDISALGRIGRKIIAIYLFTTVLAVGVGIAVFFLIKPGDPSIASSLAADASAYTSQTINVSIKDTIVGIVPSDIVSPFLNLNMLQILFMAIIFGIATNMLGTYSSSLTDLFSALNELFLKVTNMVISLMPIAVFCSVLSMMLTMGARSILSVVGVFGTFVLGLVIMMLLYGVLMVILGRIDPLPFYRKYLPVMPQVFAMASSNASILMNMDACSKNGVSKKIYSLAVPLGATINMDGTCVYMAVFSLALARIYGVAVPASAIVSLVFSIIILSIGAPGIPGSGLICISVLLTQMNVPVEAVGLIMGIDALCGMFRAMSNCLGDVSAAIIVARSEGELNMDVYKS